MSESATGWRHTACILCECNCGIEVEVEGRRLARIRGDRAHPASQGYTCNKALRLDHYQNGRHRLSSPLRRRGDGTFEEIDWDTAIAEVAQRFAAVRDAYGGETIFYYGGGGQGNHLGGAYSGAFLRALGARYRSSALAQEKMGEWFVDAHLYGGHTRGDFEHAEVAVFVGKNPWQSQGFPRARVTLRELARDPQRALIVIDPVRTETAEIADFHLRVAPGTDAWCLAALLGAVVQGDLVDGEFLAEHTCGAPTMLCWSATLTSSTWRLPASPRSCQVSSDADHGGLGAHIGLLLLVEVVRWTAGRTSRTMLRKPSTSRTRTCSRESRPRWSHSTLAASAKPE